MSAYSDWKCGALSDEEYRDLENREARRDAYFEALYDDRIDHCNEEEVDRDDTI